MTATPQLVASALGLGVAYAAAPGAVNTEALRRGLSRGFRPALFVQLGALIGDAAWAALALSGAAVLVRSTPMRVVLGAVGAVFLARFGWRALRGAWSGAIPGASSPTARGAFAAGAVFSLANPFAVAFWLGVGGGLASTVADRPGAGTFALFFVAYLLGALLWCLAMAVLVAWGRRFVRPALFRWVDALCGLALSYFGLRLLWTTLLLLV